jgi:hypothetical protein
MLEGRRALGILFRERKRNGQIRIGGLTENSVAAAAMPDLHEGMILRAVGEIPVHGISYDEVMQIVGCQWREDHSVVLNMSAAPDAEQASGESTSDSSSSDSGNSDSNSVSNSDSDSDSDTDSRALIPPPCGIMQAANETIYGCSRNGSLDTDNMLGYICSGTRVKLTSSDIVHDDYGYKMAKVFVLDGLYKGVQSWTAMRSLQFAIDISRLNGIPFNPQIGYYGLGPLVNSWQKLAWATASHRIWGACSCVYTYLPIDVLWMIASRIPPPKLRMATASLVDTKWRDFMAANVTRRESNVRTIQVQERMQENGLQWANMGARGKVQIGERADRDVSSDIMKPHILVSSSGLGEWVVDQYGNRKKRDDLLKEVGSVISRQGHLDADRNESLEPQVELVADAESASERRVKSIVDDLDQLQSAAEKKIGRKRWWKMPSEERWSIIEAMQQAQLLTAASAAFPDIVASAATADAPAADEGQINSNILWRCATGSVETVTTETGKVALRLTTVPAGGDAHGATLVLDGAATPDRAYEFRFEFRRDGAHRIGNSLGAKYHCGQRSFWIVEFLARAPVVRVSSDDADGKRNVLATGDLTVGGKHDDATTWYHVNIRNQPEHFTCSVTCGGADDPSKMRPPCGDDVILFCKRSGNVDLGVATPGPQVSFFADTTNVKTLGFDPDLACYVSQVVASDSIKM